MKDRYMFRGLDIHTGEWCVGYYVYFPTAVTVGDFGGVHSISVPPKDPDCESRTRDINLATLGQCTGISAAKSYRGTEPKDLLIFEGDIVRYCDCYIPAEDNDEHITDWRTGTVEWCGDSEYPAFDLDMHDFDSNGISAIFGKGMYIEIIGSIHEPEVTE